MKNPNNDEMNDANDPNSVADLFNKYFASVFHNDSDLVTKDDIDTRNIDENCLSDIDLTVNDIYPLLHSLNEHKATGPDGIPNKILKETAQQTAPSLCLLFNLSLRCDSLPEEWKTSNIVPVFKKGKQIMLKIIILLCCQISSKFSNAVF